MRYQQLPQPDLSKKIGETQWLTEKTVLKPLLNKHMAPKGKLGLIVVKEGTCAFVWEDTPLNQYTIDKEHPFVIEPERYHHVIITEAVVFKVEFYQDSDANNYDELADRPGQDFI
jgi:tellurite resistance-related uncharacterized protein